MDAKKYLDKDGVVRYEPTEDPEQLKANSEDFVKEAAAGKVICITDLIGSAETIYLNNYEKRFNKKEVK